MVIRLLQRLQWSLRYKVGVAFLLILLCFIVNGLISSWLIMKMNNAGELQRQNGNHVQRVQFLDLAFPTQLDTYTVAVFSSIDQVRTDYQHSIVNQLIIWYNDYDSPGEQEFETKFSRLYSKATQIFSEMEQQLNKHEFQLATQKYRDSMPLFSSITNLINARQEEVKVEGDESKKIIQDSTILSLSVIGGLTVFSIFLIILILWLNESVVIRPLNKLRKGLEKVAEGDFEQQLEIPNRDEIGKLAASFTTALGYLRQMVRGVRIGEQLQSVTGQLSSVSNQQKTGATEQVSALMQVLASTQELERTAAQIAESAAQVAELSSDTLNEIGRVEQVGQINQQRTQKMAAAVSSTLSGVEQVGQQVEEFSQLMSDLGKRTDKIEKVVELLGSIADEVHLLALNASIEAAGAGQYGDRFRVVAQQIKQLAKRANQATTEANVLIRDVQGSCRDATVKVDDGLVVVSRVVTTSGELGQALEELELGSQQISLAFNEVRQISDKLNNEAEGIKQATAQQRASSTQVIGAVNLVEGVAQQNVTSAQQVVSSTSGLENLTHQLNEVLNQVKLAA